MAGNLVVVAADPGVTVGWCILRIPAPPLRSKGLVESISRASIRCGQFRSEDTSQNVDTWLAIAREAYERLADDEDYFALVCEGFTLQMLSSDPSLLEPVRFNAVLSDRLRGTEQGVEYQLPSDAKRSVNDARLALWGLADMSKHSPDHGRDAMRHALFYCRRWSADEKVRDRTGWHDPEKGRGDGELSPTPREASANPSGLPGKASASGSEGTVRAQRGGRGVVPEQPVERTGRSAGRRARLGRRRGKG